MSESLDGLSVAAMRQNAGRLFCAPPRPPRAPPPAPGGVNAPAATDSAAVIVVSGNLSDARLSHDEAAVSGAAVRAPTATAAAATTTKTIRARMMRTVIGHSSS